MNIIQIYNQYSIPKNLQLHMLRVTSIAKIITDNWTGSAINADAVIRACLFHDIAKPMKFDLTKQLKFGLSQTEVENIKSMKRELQEKYGDDEYTVARAICKDVGCSAETIKIMENLSWRAVPMLIEKQDMESLVLLYSDMRISPYGIMTLKQRLEDLKSRTGEDIHEENGITAEKVIASNVSVDLNKISEEDLARNFSSLESIYFS